MSEIEDVKEILKKYPRLILIDLDHPEEHAARFSIGTMCGTAVFSIDDVDVASE